MLKADLHLHTSEDPHEHILYSARDLIDYAKTLGFEVLAITCHEFLLWSKSLKQYAKEKGILLIPAAELHVEGCDILAYNIKKGDVEKIKKISDLKWLRERKNVLIAAPHPYYIYRSLGKNLEKYIDLFDAIEYCHFYIRWFNRPNKKAARIAHKYGKTLIGNSDAHHMWKVNTTYTLVDSKKDVNSVIEAIKKGKAKVVTKHLSLFRVIRTALETLFMGLKNSLKNKKI